MTRKRSPSRETKTQACPALLGVSNQHQAGGMVEVGLPVARVASLLLAWLCLKKLKRFEHSLFK